MLQHSRKTSIAEQRRQILKQRRQAAQIRQLRQKQQGVQKARLLSHQARRQERTFTSKAAIPRGTASRVPVVSRKPLYPPESHLDRKSTPRTQSTPQLQRQKLAQSGPVRSTQVSPGMQWIGQGLKFGFFGLGISAMVGTAIAILHPEPRPGTFAASLIKSGEKPGKLGRLSGAQFTANPLGMNGLVSPPVVVEGKELKEAKAKIQALASSEADLSPGMFFYNPETGDYLDLAGDQSFSAASTIKFPVLVAFFQDVDAGKIRLDEQLTMRKDLIASESGAMQYQPPGTQFSAMETANNMITVSDNTATNMLIDRLGGAEVVNQRIKGWGLLQTVIRNPLPDLEGTNTVSPKDLSTLMLKVGQGDLLSAHSRDRMLEILRHTVTNTLLTPGLGEGATIAHKTGDIGSVVGDVGLIQMPNGQRYVATVLVKRPHNDPRAQELIRQISGITYQSFSQAKSVPNPISVLGATPTSSSPATAAAGPVTP